MFHNPWRSKLFSFFVFLSSRHAPSLSSFSHVALSPHTPASSQFGPRFFICFAINPFYANSLSLKPLPLSLLSFRVQERLAAQGLSTILNTEQIQAWDWILTASWRVIKEDQPEPPVKDYVDMSDISYVRNSACVSCVGGLSTLPAWWRERRTRLVM